MPGLSLQQSAFFSLPFLFHPSAGPRPSGVRMRSPPQDATQCGEKRMFYPQMTDRFRRIPKDQHFRISVLRSAALAPALLAGDRRAQASAAPLLLSRLSAPAGPGVPPAAPGHALRDPPRTAPRPPSASAPSCVSFGQPPGLFRALALCFPQRFGLSPYKVVVVSRCSSFTLQLIVRVSARASGRPPVSSAVLSVPSQDCLLSGLDYRRAPSRAANTYQLFKLHAAAA